MELRLANDEKVFRLGDEMIVILGGTADELPDASVTGTVNGKVDTSKLPCGYKYYYPITHARDDYFSNPKNADKMEV